MQHTYLLLAVIAILNTGVAHAAKKQYAKAVFHVEIHCDACEKKIQENIAFEKGLKDLTIDRQTETVTITWDPQKTDTATLKLAFEKIKKPVSKIDIQQQAQ